MGCERYRIRVKEAPVLGGLAATNQRLRVMPGEYVAFWLSRNRPGSVEQEPALRVLDAIEQADGRWQGELDLFAADWPELRAWPDLPERFPLQVLGRAADEQQADAT